MSIKYNSMKSSIIPVIASSIISLSSLSMNVHAGEYENGLAEYHKGNYSKAFQLFKNSAESGEARGQFILSTMYRRGLGIEKNEQEGFFWCKQAAEQEIVEAKFQLGLMYMEGEGVTDDETEAIKWLWSAAELGYPQASDILQYLFSDQHDEDFNIGC
ncbi:MAG: sel1 repeat family protein [gamma proteobacterium symbiont of Taylorina sp.]|nr:sel1 repeat family protein [gamma proteobacterium symbiont of Taylorina sp.]